MLILDRFLGRVPVARQSVPTEAVALQDVMDATRRELALLASDLMGVQSYLGQLPLGGGMGNPRRASRQLFRDIIEESPMPFMVIDPRPGLHIVEINRPYGAATLTEPGQVCGSKLFDIFPDNPDLADADGVGNLYDSLRKAAESAQRHTMAVQRYDVRRADGVFVEKYWRPMNTPIFDERGDLAFLLHQAMDVTEEIMRSI